MRLKYVTLLLIACLMLNSHNVVFAAEATEQDFLAANTAQKNYYNNNYLLCVNNYNKALENLKSKINNTDFETADQAQRVIDFLTDLYNRRSAFFGTIEDIGKSNYEVSHLRDAMYASSDSGDYATAISYCNKLKNAIKERVTFITQMTNEIKGFTIILPALSITDVAVDYKVTKTSGNSWFGFDIVIKNKTTTPIEAWTLKFSFKEANITSVWTDGGTMRLSKNNDMYAVSMLNRFQNGYTIPPNGSITIHGSVESDSKSAVISEFTFTGTRERTSEDKEQ